MKRESKLWIYFLLQLLEQLEKQGEEMPSFLQIAPQELAAVKDDLFDLTVEQTIDTDRLTDDELQKEVLSKLLVFVADSKRFPKKSDLLQFAEKLGTKGLNGNRTIAHIVGTIFLAVQEYERLDLERLLKLMRGGASSTSNLSSQPNTPEENFTWLDFMESVKK